MSLAQVKMRDSKDPNGPQLHYSEGSWRDFVAAVRAGEFDLPGDGTAGAH
jgi:hypothetical protein